MKRRILKSIWNFIKFATLIAILEFFSMNFSPTDYLFPSLPSAPAIRVDFAINGILSLAILAFVAIKGKYIVFERGNKPQNAISILFIIASVLWIFLMIPVVITINWMILYATFD